MFSEADNTHDSYRRAVAVYKDGSVVGHVPSEGAPACVFWLLKHNRTQVTGRQDQMGCSRVT